MRSRILLAVGAVLAAGVCGAAWAKDAPVLLEKGLQAEETAGDLDKAIVTYRQIVEQAEAERGQVAEARYRLGMSYLKKGEKEKAQEAFEKLLTLYPDQTKLAEAAWAELGKLAPRSSRIQRFEVGPQEAVFVATARGAAEAEALAQQQDARGGSWPTVSVPVASSGALSAARLQLADVEAEVVAGQAELEAKQKALETAAAQVKTGRAEHSELDRAQAEFVKAEAQLKAAQEKKEILMEEVARLRAGLQADAALRARNRGRLAARFPTFLVGEIPAATRAPLSQVVELGFDQTPMAGVVEYLQQVMGDQVQFLLFARDVSPDGAPVTLNVFRTLEQGLNLICEQTHLAWTVDGTVVKIGRRERFQPLPSAVEPMPPGGVGFGGAPGVGPVQK
jgi:hypothetical protein